MDVTNQQEDERKLVGAMMEQRSCELFTTRVSL